MSSKSTVRSTTHRLSTTKKAIHKRSSRPQASVAVKTATQTLLPRGHHSASLATHRAVTPTSSQASLTPSHSNALSNQRIGIYTFLNTHSLMCKECVDAH